MAYRLPEFILPANIWRWSHWHGTIPPSGAPDVTCLVNLIPGRRNMDIASVMASYLLLPKGTDIRFSESGSWATMPTADPDLVEVPAGTSRYYRVWDTEISGGGFANEHVVASMTKFSPWTGGGSGSGGGGSVTMIGDDQWLQTGSQTGSALVGAACGSVIPNDLIVLVAGANPTASMMVSDTFGNTYNLLGNIAVATGGSLNIWWAKNIGTGTLNTTVAVGGTVKLSSGIVVYRGFGSTLHNIAVSGNVGVGSLVTFPVIGAFGIPLDICVAALDATVSLLSNAPSPPFVIDSASSTASPPDILPYAIMRRANDFTVYVPTMTLFGSGNWSCVSTSFAT